MSTEINGDTMSLESEDRVIVTAGVLRNMPRQTDTVPDRLVSLGPSG